MIKTRTFVVGFSGFDSPNVKDRKEEGWCPEQWVVEVPDCIHAVLSATDFQCSVVSVWHDEGERNGWCAPLTWDDVLTATYIEFITYTDKNSVCVMSDLDPSTLCRISSSVVSE